MLKKIYITFVSLLLTTLLQAQNTWENLTSNYYFVAGVNEPSATQFFQVSADGFLTPGSFNVSVDVPFEVSLNEMGPYSTDLDIAIDQYNGDYELPTTNVYIRYNPSIFGTGNDAGVLILTGTGRPPIGSNLSGSITTAVQESLETRSIRLSPNPSADGILNIINADDIEITSLQVINTQGTEILHKNVTNNNIDLSLLHSGLYYIILNSSKGNLCQRVVIN